MSHRAAWSLLAGTALVCLSGCVRQPTHLIFYQSSILGVDAATSADSSTVHVVLGYDRQTGTIIPKSNVRSDPASKEEPEAMSVVSRGRIKVQWLRPSEVCERFGTGQAARNIARNGAAHALRAEGAASVAPKVCEGF